jgi:outer membrane lipoprotein-sorting protein
LLLPLLVSAEVSEAQRFLESWLAKQAQVTSWAADVVQTRKLKSLVRPLQSRGRVWVRSPNRFRWQLGEPPRTIAVRTDTELQIVYPLLRRVERYNLTETLDPSWRQVLALLELGLPSKPSEFYARYELVAAEPTSDGWRFELRPVATDARRFIDRVRLEVAKQDATIRANELVFADGSSMRTEFTNHQLNPALDEALFKVEAGEGFEIIDGPSGD